MMRSWALLFLVSIRAQKEDGFFPVYADRTGPYAAPRETYPFEDLPTCEFANLENKVRPPLSFPDLLRGKRATLSSRIRIPIKPQPTSGVEEICRMRFTKEHVRLLNRLIESNYYYSYDIGDFPAMAFVGIVTHNTSTDADTTDSQPATVPKFYAHRTFVVHYDSKNETVGVTIVPSVPVTLKEQMELRLTYDVRYESTTYTRADFMYDSLSPFERQVSLFTTSFGLMLCALIGCSVAIIVGRRSMKGVSGGSLNTAPWRILKHQLFRTPPEFMQLSVLVAAGCHLACTVVMLYLWGLLRAFEPKIPVTMGTVFTWYCLMQPVHGMAGMAWYKLASDQSNPKMPPSLFLIQVVGMPAIFLIILLQINTAAAAYGTSNSLPIIGTTLKIVCYCLFLLCPLNLIGTIMGTRIAAQYQSSRISVSAIRRPVPRKANWTQAGIAVLAGLLPFGLVVIPINFLLESIWGQRVILHSVGYVLVGLILFYFAVAATTLSAVYLLLSFQDHRWPWFAFCCGASSAIYFGLLAAYLFKSYAVDFLTGFCYVLSTSMLIGIMALSAGAVGVISTHVCLWQISRENEEEAAEYSSLATPATED